MPQISVTAASDRENPEEKMGRCVALDQQAPDKTTRLRIPVTIYDRSSGSYKAVPDAAWTVGLVGLSQEQIEDFVRQVGEKIRDLAQGMQDGASDSREVTS